MMMMDIIFSIRNRICFKLNLVITFVFSGNFLFLYSSILELSIITKIDHLLPINYDKKYSIPLFFLFIIDISGIGWFITPVSYFRIWYFWGSEIFYSKPFFFLRWSSITKILTQTITASLTRILNLPFSTAIRIFSENFL